MAEEIGIHFRTGGKLTHAGCEMLPNGKDIGRIVIERIEYKDSESINGRVEKGIWLAHFAPNAYTTLPLVLNATNRKRIAKLFPECGGYINLLKNVAVRLTREKCRDVQDGGETYGLRISKIPADAAPAKKVVTADKVAAVAEWAKKEEKDMAFLIASFDMTDEVKKSLKKAMGDGV